MSQLGHLVPIPFAGFLPWFVGPQGTDHLAKGRNRAQSPKEAQSPFPGAQGPDPGPPEGPGILSVEPYRSPGS